MRKRLLHILEACTAEDVCRRIQDMDGVIEALSKLGGCGLPRDRQQMRGNPGNSYVKFQIPVEESAGEVYNESIRALQVRKIQT